MQVEAGRSRHLAADPSLWLVHTCHPSKNMCTSRAAECNQFCAFVIRLVLQSPDFVVFLCRVLTSIARSIVEKTRKESSVDLIAWTVCTVGMLRLSPRTAIVIWPASKSRRPLYLKPNVINAWGISEQVDCMLQHFAPGCLGTHIRHWLKSGRFRICPVTI